MSFCLINFTDLVQNPNPYTPTLTTMTLEAAFDELIATNELKAFCDSYITSMHQKQACLALEDLAVALSGDLAQP